MLNLGQTESAYRQALEERKNLLHEEIEKIAHLLDEIVTANIADPYAEETIDPVHSGKSTRNSTFVNLDEARTQVKPARIIDKIVTWLRQVGQATKKEMCIALNLNENSTFNTLTKYKELFNTKPGVGKGRPLLFSLKEKK